MHCTQKFLEKIYGIGLFLTIILVVADLVAFFHYADNSLGKIFLATREQTPLTWLSVVALFLIGLAALSISQEKSKRTWFAVALIFFFFSMDDATYFHERVSGFLVHHTNVFTDFPTYIWMIVYAPLLLFGLGIVMQALWREGTTDQKKVILFACGLLIFAMGLDIVDGFFDKNDELTFCQGELCQEAFTHLMRLNEEVAETLALGILGYKLIKTFALSRVEGRTIKTKNT